MSASLNKAATTHGYHTLPHPLLNGVPQRRMRLTVETDASWVSVTSDQHDGPGFSLTVRCDGTALSVSLDQPAGKDSLVRENPASA